MERRLLGPVGPAVSVVGLGCNNFGRRMDAEATRTVVHAALDAGINHFDTAETYGDGNSERYLGAALGARRDEVVIATKFSRRPVDEPYTPGVLARRIEEGCEGSLRRLNTDRIDVYYQHFPDPAAPADEAIETLNRLVQAGKVLAIGSSNPSAAQVAAEAALAAERGLAPFTCVQTEWSVLARGGEKAVIPAARQAGLGLIPYFPLAHGLLSGKYHRDQPFPAESRLATSPNSDRLATPENFDKLDALSAFASDHDHSILELAIAWLTAQDGVSSVIAGATKPDQVRANAAAAAWRLTPDELRDIDNLV